MLHDSTLSSYGLKATRTAPTVATDGPVSDADALRRTVDELRGEYEDYLQSNGLGFMPVPGAKVMVLKTAANERAVREFAQRRVTD